MICLFIHQKVQTENTLLQRIILHRIRGNSLAAYMATSNDTVDHALDYSSSYDSDSDKIPQLDGQQLFSPPPSTSMEGRGAPPTRAPTLPWSPTALRRPRIL